MLVEGNVQLTLILSCDRCLKVVKVPVELVFEQELFSPEAVSQMEEQIIPITHLDNYNRAYAVCQSYFTKVMQRFLWRLQVLHWLE